MRKFQIICVAFWLCVLLAGIGRAETFQLTDGSAVTGDVISFNESGLILRQPDDKYSDRVPWTKFSQDDLKKLAQNPKIAATVAPFIEATPVEKPKKTEVEIKPVPRLERPAARSLFGALTASGLGVTVLLLIYAANLFAAYEISIFRARPPALVCGVAAVAPFVGPIIFLSMPTRLEVTAEEAAAAEAEAAAPTPTFAVPGQPAATEPATAEEPAHGGLRLADAPSGAAAGVPQTQVFQRGAFTFNRRFFETKFSGFFGLVRRDTDKDLVLFIKSARGQHVGQRITRISSNELHLHVQKGAASEEVMIPFTEIQEIQLKHKDA